ncbi:MAG TPA: P1 family peptidase [Thermoanaerobacterales bacterium]|nr:P1 family peptidase [Thermoanaerobacterales bacterium]
MDTITDVEGIKVGHAHDVNAVTGCSVILCEQGATAGVDVRGGAPGTRETDLLCPKNMVEKVHAVYLSGGSAFGLDGASGVMKYLEEKGVGFDVGVAKVPIVPGAVIFDLTIGDHKRRPDLAMGYRACLNATTKNEMMGNVGAGMGATVGKILGDEFAMKGGLGTASITVKDLVVGAIVIVNCLGDVVDPDTGKIIAGALNEEKNSFADTISLIKNGFDGSARFGANTTIGTIATNAKLSKAGASKVASMAHNGYARTIRPVHTMSDGDTIFCLSTGKIDADISIVGALAAEVMAKAVVRAIKNAEHLEGRKSYKDMV